MAIEYTVKKLAGEFGVSPQAIYKQKDNNAELRSIMERDFTRKKNNSVVYGKATYDCLAKIYKDRLKSNDNQVEQLDKPLTTSEAESEKTEGEAVEQLDKPVSQLETTIETPTEKLIRHLETEIEYLKIQLEAEKEARKEDANNYIKIIEEANEAHHETRVLLLKAKEEVKLLEETKKPFFQRLKNKLVKKDD